MLWDILGIVIGFSAVMLLLSLLVTAAGQITQHFFSLRQNNLQLGLEVALNAVKVPEPEQVAKGAIKTARNPLPAPTGGMKRIAAAMSPKPQCSEMTPEALEDFVGKKVGLAEGKAAAKEFPRTYTPMKRRFALLMRYVSLGWALAIAVLFQVSTPELLSRLSTDPELRARYEAQADLVLARAETSIDRLKSYQDVSADALAELERRHPNLSAVFEEASGIGKDRETIVRELSYVLEDLPDRRAPLLREYGEILDELHREGLETAKEEAAGAINLLSLYDIGIWSRGSEFYARFDSWLGVLITAVLLTLGAPFWFNLLRGAQDLRDTLGGGKSTKSNQQPA